MSSRVASLALGGILAAACSAHAATLFYDGSGNPADGLDYVSNTWSTTVAIWANGANTTATETGWTNSSADTATFGNATGYNAAPADFTVTVGENLIMNGISVSSNLTKNLLITSGANNFTLNVGTAGIGTNQPSTGSTTIDATIIGTAGLLKYNTGLLILARDNTYSGTTIIKGNTGASNGGILQIGNGGTTGSLGTGSVQFLANGTQSGASTIRFNQSGDQTVGNSFNLSNTNNTATTVVALGGVIAQAGGGKLTLSGAVNLAATASLNPTVTYNIGRTAAIAVDTEVSGLISGTGNVAKMGTGVLLLSNANTYSGTTTLTAGTVLINADAVTSGSTITSGPLGTGALVGNSGLIGNASTTVAHTIANPVTITLNTTLGIASVGTTDAPLTFSGTVDLNGNGSHAIASASNADVTFSGVVSGAHSVILSNTSTTGRIIFSNNNTYQTNGTSTTINSGALVVANATGGSATASATGTFPVQVNATGILGGGNGALNGGAFATATGTNGSFKPTTSQTYASGVLGTVAGLVNVSTVAGVGGAIAPGNAGVGTLTVGALTLNTGATLTYEFNGTANDLIAQVANTAMVPGTTNGTTTPSVLNIAGTTAITLLQAGSTTPFATAGDYNLFTYSGTLAGSLANLSIANPQAGATYTFIDGGGVIELDIAVPEPSTWVAGVMSLGLLGYSLRRRMTASGFRQA